MSPITIALLTFAVGAGAAYALLERQARRGQFQERLRQTMRSVSPPAPEEAAAGPDPPPEVRPGETWRRRSLQRLGADGRRRRFDAQLPDTLALIVSALRSGQSLARAAQMIAEETPPPMSEEFARALGELALGLPLATALAAMAQRVGSQDLDLVVTAVATQQRVGGNLAELLSRIADTIRERIRVQGEVQTLTAEGRLSGLILVLLPPLLALLLTLRSPQYFAPLLGSPLGHVLIAGAVLGQIVGAVMIRRMVALDL